ncbi:MAG: CPBP family intramembrane metalloprotease [Candidatus Omnitrophica bacterium]|nr:CPBP family intramembrane metalloprotease [Candidatus Omnitrophota bacterium]
MIGAIITFFLVAYALYNDANILRKESPGNYYQTLAIAPWFWVLASVVYLHLSFLLVLPTYFFFRNKYFLKLKSEYRRDLIQDYKTSNFILITECASIVVIWFYLLNLIFLIYTLANVFLPFLSGQLYEFVILGLSSHAVSVVLIIIFVVRNHKEGLFKFLNFNKVKRPFLQGICLPMGIGIFFATASYFLNGIPESQAGTPLGGAISGADMLSMILFLSSVMIVAPLVEEVIYRGYLYKVISRVKSRQFSLLFITILFALFHLDQIWGSWYGFATIMAVGFFITFLRYWSNSVVPGIVAHYTYNILLVVLPFSFFYLSSPAYAKYYTFGHKLQYSEQEKLLNVCIRTEPDNSIAYNDLAWIYAQNDKNLDQALELVDKALSFEEDNPAYLDTKAEVLFRLGRVNEAIDIERKLINSYPEDVFYKQQLERFIETKNESEI